MALAHDILATISAAGNLHTCLLAATGPVGPHALRATSGLALRVGKSVVQANVPVAAVDLRGGWDWLWLWDGVGYDREGGDEDGEDELHGVWGFRAHLYLYL